MNFIKQFLCTFISSALKRENERIFSHYCNHFNETLSLPLSNELEMMVLQTFECIQILNTVSINENNVNKNGNLEDVFSTS